ncbi:hypothetical protein C8R47DRAFT_1210461 [Mycena vitilis]|nr:hypothetical protein C8R47DRAFT_1210461 [Mycena vitilis]
MHRGTDGVPYLVNSRGERLRVVNADDDRPPSSQDGQSGVPMHHSVLFRSSDESDPLGTESVLSESTPLEPGSTEYPPLALDIDPDALSPLQISQLNAIRAHLGSASSRLATSTAILAEHQAATEDIHDAISALRGEMISRADSLRNDVNSQRSRLNRCLDDNLHVLQDTGASTVQVGEILEVMNRGGRTHRRPVMDAVDSVSVSGRPPPMPAGIQNAMNAVVSPRADGESIEEFDKRAAAVLRTKDKTHLAFPLPAHEATDAITRKHTEMNSRSATLGPNASRNPNAEGVRARALIHMNRLEGNSGGRARFDEARSPVTLGSSISGYHSGVGASGHDVITDFADDMEEIIRTTIHHCVGVRVELPPNVRPAKVSNPAKYAGQDDHELFMTKLEKLLGWFRVNLYGGDDLDSHWGHAPWQWFHGS